MDCGQVQLALVREERELARDPAMMNLGERDGAGFSRRAQERDRHLIRDIERFDQDGFVAFQSGRVINQNLSELIEARVLHRSRRSHRGERFQLRKSLTAKAPSK